MPIFQPGDTECTFESYSNQPLPNPEAEPRSVAIYLDAGANVGPVQDWPQYDWVLLTAEPMDPRGICYKDIEKLKATILERLTRNSYGPAASWRLVEDDPENLRLSFEKDGSSIARLTVFHSTWFESNPSEAARQQMRTANTLYVAEGSSGLQSHLERVRGTGLLPNIGSNFILGGGTGPCKPGLE